MGHGQGWGPIRSLLALSPVLIGIPWLCIKQHYTLPEPLLDLTDPSTNLPQISEQRILGFAKYLSEDIGYRTVGTFEHALADTWMVQQAEEVQKECERIVAGTGRELECEVWHQQGSGSHRFDMMGKRLYKSYVNLTNIVIRISDGTEAGKANALLINSHLDSTLPSPGAADDALSVGVMLECIRVLINTPNWSPKHAVVFLFNNAEESLQDGSHLFSTQHPVRSTIRAAINLEAAGTTGRELLFQATSEQMIQAYSHVPRPFGTVLASDVFGSGILLSDTDFRQFEYYLNVTGLDMAVVGNSYLYHMRKDLVEHIEPGVAQHMAENTLALLQHLTSEDSPLPLLTSGYTRPSTVYFTLLGIFFMYSFHAAKIMYSALLISSLILVRFLTIGEIKTNVGFWRRQARGIMAIGAAAVGTVVTPNLVALVMSKGLNKSLSWFTSPSAAIVLYAPPTMLGALLSQYLIGPVSEQCVMNALLLLQSGLAYAIQMIGIGSAGLFFLFALPLFLALVVNPFITGGVHKISLITYAIAQTVPLLTGTLMLLTVTEVFVPLTGRMGAQAPADNIIATIVGVLGSQLIPLTIPFVHRFGRHHLWNGIIFFSILTTVMMAIFSMKNPFDEMHQRRLFILHSENITSHEQHLHVAGSDSAPGLDLLTKAIADEFSSTVPIAKPHTTNEYDSDWDPIYPFSTFLNSYSIPLSDNQDYTSAWARGDLFKVSASNNFYNLADSTRSLTIEVEHPGLIWPVIAFDAHVLKWTLDGNPPDEHARHYIRGGAFYGTDKWNVDLVIKIPPNATEQDLIVNYVGIVEKGMWPGKKAVKTEGGPAMQLFERLDNWLEEKYSGNIDALLLSCVSGITRI